MSPECPALAAPRSTPEHYDPALSEAEARAAYAAAWNYYLLSRTLPSRMFYAHVLDAVQGRCVAEGAPGPAWTAFTDSLPAYGAFWERMREVHGAQLVMHARAVVEQDPETDPECS